MTYDQAMQEDAPSWKAAIKSEYKSHDGAGTFLIMFGKPPSGVKLISSRLVLRNKFGDDGSIIRRKARLVARGFEQKYGVDYFDTFASVFRFATLRILLSKVAAEDLEADTIDIDTAFLNPDLMEDIYMEIPDGFYEYHLELRGKPYYIKLRKTIYGLKQSPRVWFLEVCKFFKSIGFRPSAS